MNLLLLLALQTTLIIASPLAPNASSPPTLVIDSATVTGVNQGALSKFLGIPFAVPPVGDLRFTLPQALTSYNGWINATSYGASCPQQTAPSPLSLSDIFNISFPFFAEQNRTNSTNSTSTPESEDCLTINVIKPSNVSADAKLPVVVWIFGGGFERGSAGGYDDQATRIVNRSMEIGQPVIYAAMNYRVSGKGYSLLRSLSKFIAFLAWGFLASKEVKAAGVGNIGLVDQRVALQWVNKYIHLFGGDPSKVTLWGQSAGAISASLQMLAYGGNSSDLFRGAFMQSGAPIPVGNLTGGQVYYDSLVNQTDCTNSTDTLSCLRSVTYDTLKTAVDNTPNYFSYQSLVLAWSPRADGVFLEDNPQKLVQQGKVMNIPIVSGNVDDEGTLFSLSSLNVTTDEQFREYISTVFVPGANSTELDPLWSYYPSDPSIGSPFNTSGFNEITPQYKRISAFQGDVVFQAPRRFFLNHLSGKQKIWSYQSWRLKYIPVLGAFHGSDLAVDVLDDYLVQFINNLDPNLNRTRDPRLPRWPEYTSQAPLLYTFPNISIFPVTLSNDTYREGPMQYLMNLSLAYPL
ncbi:carotenoid ester lipase [Flammula alnicola]|nr:carotenoid ester lipase [Flammula alnicola]